HRRDPGPGAVHAAPGRQIPRGGGQPRHAGAAPALPSGARSRVISSRPDGVRRRTALWRRAARGPRDRERIHAAAQRRRSDVHADRRSEHLAGGKHANRETTERDPDRSEEHTSELQSRGHLVCRLLLEKKKKKKKYKIN